MTVREAPTKERVSWIGQSVPRKEDQRLVRGQGQFMDDLDRKHMLYVHLVRSPHGHARIKRVDVREAEEIPGVVTLTGAEAQEMQQPFFQVTPPPGGDLKDYCLAAEKVRFVGEPVVAVAAETRELAADAAELVEVEYEPLPAVVDGVRAIEPDAPLLHEEVGSNVVLNAVYDWGDVEGAFKEADRILRIDRLHFHRYSSTPLECYAALVEYDPGTSGYTIYCNVQMPQFNMIWIGMALGVPMNKLRIITHDIGGGFGNKITMYPYLTALCLLARKTGRPVKWTETRTEQHAATSHGNERTFLDTEVALRNDGTILGLKTRAIDDVGAYTRYEPLGAIIWAQVTPGCYRIRNVYVDFSSVVTNKCPVGPNRGYSRLQHLWFLERIIDLAAHELDLDPVEIRKRNYIKPDEFPWETPNGCIYDSGNYPEALDTALKLIDYEGWRQRREQVRGTGKRIGIGIGSTLDSGTNNFGQSQLLNPSLSFSGNAEMANARLDIMGEIVVTLGTVPQGQSHETTAAQVAAELLGVTPDDVTVQVGHDTARSIYTGFSGTYASQFAVTGLLAVEGAVKKLAREIRMVAAAVLGVAEEDIELLDGTARVLGDPDRKLALQEVGMIVHVGNAILPQDLDVTLNCNHLYRPPLKVPDKETKRGNLTLTYATQIHACVLEVDEETGEIQILDYAAVDDCGRRIHPQIVEGQVHGATAQGIAAALMETFEYDESGQLLHPNYHEYHVARSVDVPHIKTGHLETPSPFTSNGAKGMGEGGGAPLHAVCSAIQDVLSQTSGAVVTDSHNPPERVYWLLRAQKEGVRLVSPASI